MEHTEIDDQLTEEIKAAQNREDTDVYEILIQIEYVRKKGKELHRHLKNDGWARLHQSHVDKTDTNQYYGEVTSFFVVLDTLHEKLLEFMKDCEAEQKSLEHDMQALHKLQSMSAKIKAFYSLESDKLHQAEVLTGLTRWHATEIKKREKNLKWSDNFTELGDTKKTDKNVLAIIETIGTFQRKLLAVHELNKGFQKDWEKTEEKLKNPHLLIAQNLRLMQSIETRGMHHACVSVRQIPLPKKQRWSLTIFFEFDKDTGEILRFEGSEPEAGESNMVAKMELTTDGSNYLIRGLYCQSYELKQLSQIAPFAKNVLYKTSYFYNKRYGYKS